VTRFAVSFLLVFGELALGGAFALAIPPFFQVERGFYKSSASVYLAAGLVAAVGLGLLAARGHDGDGPGAVGLWLVAAVWLLFCIVLTLYLWTLWRDDGLTRARAYTSVLAVGLIAVGAHVMLLKPGSFGLVGASLYVLTAIGSSLVLGLASGGMLFGHWYLIDPNLPVDYLRSFVRLLGGALLADLALLAFTLAMLRFAGGPTGAAAIRALWDSHSELLAIRIVLGPVATLALAWMCWETLQIPQTMAATGLLYIAVMSSLVGEMLGRFILFRTSVPL
jgi:hypothetical protein